MAELFGAPRRVVGRRVGFLTAAFFVLAALFACSAVAFSFSRVNSARVAVPAKAGSKGKRPVVSSLSPGVGSTAGGTKVTITGSNFVKVKAVKFGKSKGSKVRVLSSRKLTVLAPKHTVGKVSVVVVAKHGSSKSSSRSVLTFEMPDTLSIVAGIAGVEAPPTPGLATHSHLDDPQGVAVSPSGNLYIADGENDVVEKVTPSGKLSIVAGIPGVSGLPKVGKATDSHLDYPTGVALGPNGDLYIGDQNNGVVEKVTPSGKLSIFAGVAGQNAPPTPGPATHSHLGYPHGLAVAPNGDVYIADSNSCVVDKVTPSGKLSIVAGVAGTAGKPTAGRATSSKLYYPEGVALSANGDLYIEDTDNGVIEKVTPAGKLTIVVNDPNVAQGIAISRSGDLYLANGVNDVVEKVTPSGKVSVVAGVAGMGGPPTAGPATSSDLNNPYGIALSPDGELYIADYSNEVVEKVFDP